MSLKIDTQHALTASDKQCPLGGRHYRYSVIDSAPPCAASFDVEKKISSRPGGGHGKPLSFCYIVIDSAPPGPVAASFDVEKINYACEHESRHKPGRPRP